MSLTKSLLKQVVVEQNKVALEKLKHYVKRDIENKVVNTVQKTNFVTVLTGVRRSGKSTLLTYLRTHYFKPSYYINFDDDRLINFKVKDYQALLEVFLELYGKAKYVFLDEVQNVAYWERFVNRLKEQGYKVFVTGSNSNLLSKEFGTFLTGRYIEYKVFPFSFVEYLRFKKLDVESIKNKLKTSEDIVLKVKLLKHFKKYFKLGGFPEFLFTRNLDFLQNLYESILYKDIIARYNIKADTVIKQIANIGASNVAKPISFRSYKALGVKSSTTISQYFEYLTNSYLFFLLPKFAFSVRSQMLARKKLYVIDNALANYVGFRPTTDKGRFLENMVFLHLIRNVQTELFYYTAGNGDPSKSYECDFVYIDKNLNSKSINLYQVTLELTEENYTREINGLVSAYKFFKNAGYNIKKLYILTWDQSQELFLKPAHIKQKISISVMPVWRFLLYL